MNAIITVRKYIKWIWKRLLPPSFYHFNTHEDQEVFNYKGLPVTKKIILNFFFFLLYIRLWILAETFIFLIFNYLLVYLLILNSYLLTSSIISSIFVFSRWTFFLEEKTFSEFKHRFSGMERIPEGETLYPSWENAQTVGIFIVRYLSETGEAMIKKDTKAAVEGFEIGSELSIGYLNRFLMHPKYAGLNHKIHKKVKFIMYYYHDGYMDEVDESGKKIVSYKAFTIPWQHATFYTSYEDRNWMLNDAHFNRKDTFSIDKIYLNLMHSIYKLKKRNSLFFSTLAVLFS